MTARSRDRLVYTVEEAAALLGVARSTMYELVRVGEVASVRIGRRVFVTAPTISGLTGVTPPPPAELAARRIEAAKPTALQAGPADAARPERRRRAAPASDGDAQRPLFG